MLALRIIAASKKVGNLSRQRQIGTWLSFNTKIRDQNAFSRFLHSSHYPNISIIISSSPSFLYLIVHYQPKRLLQVSLSQFGHLKRLNFGRLGSIEAHYQLKLKLLLSRRAIVLWAGKGDPAVRGKGCGHRPRQ